MCIFATFFINLSDFWKHFEDMQKNDKNFERKFYYPFINILQNKEKNPDKQDMKIICWVTLFA